MNELRIERAAESMNARIEGQGTNAELSLNDALKEVQSSFAKAYDKYFEQRPNAEKDAFTAGWNAATLNAQKTYHARSLENKGEQL